MDGREHEQRPVEPEDQQTAAPDAGQTAAPNAGASAAPPYPLPPSGHLPAYSGTPYPPPGYPYPGQPEPANQAGSAPGSTPQQYAGWPAAPGMPYGYYMPPAGQPARTSNTRQTALVILGVVTLLVVVCVAGSVGILALVGPQLGAGSPFANLGHPSVAPTPMTYGYSYTDSLNGARTFGWEVDQYCSFKDGAYHVNPGPSYGGVTCLAPTTDVSDVDVRVTASEGSGPLNYGYGLVFRYAATGSFYVFLISSNGTAWFDKFTNWNVTHVSPAWYPTHFVSGLGAHNTLRVIGKGTLFTFYVNGYWVGQARDSSYSSGWVTFYSGDYNLDAAFTNLELHGNP